MSRETLAPFSRGLGAPLAGLTVLQIVPRLEGGGDERATLEVASALVRGGARSLVACEPGPRASDLQALGGLHIPFPASARNPVTMALNVRKFARLLEAERVDLVHARSRAPAWVALGACRRIGRPLVTTFYGSDDAATPTRRRYNSVMAQGDRVIASSHHAAERVAALYPAARSRLRVVRPGADLALFSPASVDNGRVARARQAWSAGEYERIVLLPGRMSPARGQTLLVEAAALLKRRGLEDARFVLAGEAGEAARELDALIRKLGLSGLVARAAPPRDMPAALLAASLVVLPATEPAGVGRSAIEAQAMGAPTLIADLGPARELVLTPPEVAPEARTGWRVVANDAAALAEAIERALAIGASAREALGRRARAHVLASYSVERMTRDTLAVYGEALGL